MDASLPPSLDLGRVLHGVNTAVLMISGDVIIFENSAAQALLQDEHQGLLGQPFHTLLLPDDQARVQPGEPRQEVQLRCWDDSLIWTELTWERLDESAEPLFLLTIIDIRERKAQVASFYAQEQLLKTVIQNIPANVWAIDTDGVYTFAGGGNYSAELGRLVGQSIYALFSNVPGFNDETRRVLSGETVDREREWLGRVYSTHYAPLYNAAGQIMGAVGVGFDITDLKAALDALRQSEQQYRYLVEQAFEAIFVLEDERAILVNNSALKLLGYPRDAFQHLNLVELVHPDDVPTLERIRQALLKGVGGLAEFRVRHQDGRWISVEGSAVPLDTRRIQVIVRDITPRKQAEQAALEQERLRAELEKEQAVNKFKTQLMRRIAHEFRSPLGSIQTAADMLVMFDEKLAPDRRQERLRVIQAEIDRLALMLDDIAQVVRNPLNPLALYMEYVDLNRVCQTAITDIQRGRDTKHELVYATDDQPHGVRGDEKVLLVVLTNLLSNASKYSPPGSTIRLRLRRVQEQVMLQVSDEGIGIPQNDLPHIFEPFYRGSNFDEISGLGLGLTIVRDGVEAHQGSITVESVPEQGTTFTISLPCV
jgi:PAS domain S-box-containing protein